MCGSAGLGSLGCGGGSRSSISPVLYETVIALMAAGVGVMGVAFAVIPPLTFRRFLEVDGPVSLPLFSDLGAFVFFGRFTCLLDTLFSGASEGPLLAAVTI